MCQRDPVGSQSQTHDKWAEMPVEPPSLFRAENVIVVRVPSSAGHSRARGARTGCPLLPRASTSSYHALDGGGARRRRRRGYVSDRRSRLAVPHSRSSTQSAGRADSSSSARFADRPSAPPSGDSSPPSRRGPGLASGSAPETPRRLAPLPGIPGDGDVASGDPPQVSQSPREEGTPREERGGARRRGSQHGCREEDETTQVQGEEESARSRERGAAP